jgi:hypothetical protein
MVASLGRGVHIECSRTNSVLTGSKYSIIE